MTLVMFDQSYEHEGSAFIDSEKIFIRSELIFEVRSLEHNPAIGGLFTQAVYFTGESLYQNEFAEDAHRLYERVNQMHWGDTDSNLPSVYIRKRFHSCVDFITNGQDYWFLKESGSLKQCAMIVVMDYFNCKLSQGSFRSLCEIDKLKLTYNPDVDQQIWDILAEFKSQQVGVFTQTDEQKKTQDFPGVFDLYKYEFPKIRYHDEWVCCPYHCFDSPSMYEDAKPFFSTRNAEIVDIYQLCQVYSRKKLENAPLVFLGEEMQLDESTLVIDGDKIYFSEGLNKFPDRINFAANWTPCWTVDYDPREFIGVDETILAPRLLLPPLCFESSAHGFRFRVDFFQNDWQICVNDSRMIPVPTILDFHDSVRNEKPFFAVLNRSEKELDLDTKPRIHSADSDTESPNKKGWHRLIESEDEEWESGVNYDIEAPSESDEEPILKVKSARN